MLDWGLFRNGAGDRTMSLRKMLSTQAMVRDGQEQMIPRDVVPGDILIFSTRGQKWWSMRWWFRTAELRVDESVLTGESRGHRQGRY
jgi:magnesium-transporting ATPase (P-type)